VPHTLTAGERVLLIDPKDRRYLLTLVDGAMFHTHAGIVAHDDIIGGDEGRTVAGSTGRLFLVLRPTLSDIVLKMPRGAQVIYPKDLGAILIAADIAPGQRVLEAGVGSGALSMTVLRAGASIVGYELREDFAERAQANVAATLGPDAPYKIEIRDVTEGIDERDLDRILLDMPEPHKVLPGAVAALRPGGILLAYLPTINQTALLRQALEAEGSGFGLCETQEIMRRTWHIAERSVRPDHRMVGHTGFLTTARRLSSTLPPRRGAADAEGGAEGEIEANGEAERDADEDETWPRGAPGGPSPAR
jgi:tRNA (adenine57-N1/adenine58-N1)-methyltransferase